MEFSPHLLPHLVDAPFLSSHKYAEKGKDLGVSVGGIRRAVQVRERVLRNGAVPVLTLRHLSLLVGVDWPFLRSVVTRAVVPYRFVSKKSRFGKERHFAIPDDALADVQRWILRYILDSADPHPASFAYRKGRSAVLCARKHLGCRHLIKMDIKDYFGSIEERAVYNVFANIGYPSLLSFEMTRLCTVRPQASTRSSHGRQRYLAIPHYRKGSVGVLPQGGPASGALANLGTIGLDEELSQLADSYGCVYTRYSDDIAISSGLDLTLSEQRQIVSRVSSILGRHGFQANKYKTRLIGPGAARILLGLDVSDSKLRVERVFVKRLKYHIWAARKYGVASHAEFTGFFSPVEFANYIDGCLAYVTGVDPGLSRDLRESWNSIRHW